MTHVTVEANALRTLLFCSVRYAVGRQTYMPNLVQEIVREHAIVLSRKDREQLASEIETMPNLGDPGIDEPEWRRFIAWLRVGDPPPR